MNMGTSVDTISYYLKISAKNYAGWKSLCLSMRDNIKYEEANIGAYIIKYENNIFSFMLYFENVTFALKISDKIKTIFKEIHDSLDEEEIDAKVDDLAKCLSRCMIKNLI